MNKETFEALKNLVGVLEIDNDQNELTQEQEKNLEQVNNWIDEVAKEYQKGGEQE